MTGVLIGLVVGAVLGFYVGRFRAEIGAARHNGRQAMHRRADYRRKR